MNHPLVDRTLLTGYPNGEDHLEIGTDPLGNEVYTGDKILVLDDEFYLAEELSSDAIEVLENHEATYKFAK